jgi:hypothetical protein
MIVASVELIAKTEENKNPILVLLIRITNRIPNSVNWVIVTVQCITLIKRDLALISSLTLFVYPKRIQDPNPYPIKTINANNVTSVSLLYGRTG